MPAAEWETATAIPLPKMTEEVHPSVAQSVPVNSTLDPRPLLLADLARACALPRRLHPGRPKPPLVVMFRCSTFWDWECLYMRPDQQPGLPHRQKPVPRPRVVAATPHVPSRVVAAWHRLA
jgi:hypothetical protein